MINYNLGATYNKNLIDVRCERIPKTPIFNARENETHFFEKRERFTPLTVIINALENNYITKLDKDILSLVAVFGSACVTSKVLQEMLTMAGKEFTLSMFESSIKRLFRYNLINFSHFKEDGKDPAPFKIITLTHYGSKTATQLGVKHRFNALAVSTAEVHTLKARTQTASLVSNYLKNMTLEKFAVRPVIIRDANSGAIVRPSATITLNEDLIINFEVIRRHDGWKEDLMDKLHRYELSLPDRDNIMIRQHFKTRNFSRYIYKKSLLR